MFIRFDQWPEFHEFQHFVDMTDHDQRRSRSLSNKRNRRSRSRNRRNEEEDTDVQILIEGFDNVFISGIDSPTIPLTFNAAFASFRELNENEIARRKRKKRRYLFWNCGSIHGSLTNRNGMPLLKEEFKEMIKNIHPVGILLNEMRLQSETVGNFQNNFKNQLSDLGYVIMSYEESYVASSHWIRGSAILIHKSISDQFHSGGTISAEDYGFEVVSVRDSELDIPVYCCYFPSGLHRDNTRKEVAFNSMNMWTNGVGAGDLNMSLNRFNEISNLDDCMHPSWLTHKSGGEHCQPTKIDYVFKSRSQNKIFVKVHKPLLPDSYLSDAHFPIIFDVFRNGGNPPAKTYCDDHSCEFACGRRQGGMRAQQRSASEGRRGARRPRSQSRRRN